MKPGTGPIFAAALAGFIGCADLGQYVWIDQLPEVTPSSDKAAYSIGPGDVLLFRVFGQEGMTTRAKVRADGKVSLPLLNDVEAAGYTPGALGDQLQTRLKDFIKLPLVTVSVEETRPLAVTVIGEVAKPGVVQLEPGSGVLQALVLAGGLTDFAHKDRIFLVRRSPASARIRFRLEALTRGEGPSPRFLLQSNDVIDVE